MKIYLPIIFGQDKKIHSLQLGWSATNRIPTYQRELKLSGGGDQHLLEPENAMQCVQVEEIYQAINDAWNIGFEPHCLTYNKAEQRFKRPEEATAWVKTHQGKRYIIGNEPDGGYLTGGNDMTESEYADFYYRASQLIRKADPTAYLMMAGWAGGVGLGDIGLPIPNEHNVMKIYNERYGKMDVDCFSWHYYQSIVYDNMAAVDKMERFAEYARMWKSNGWADTDDIAITELGWYGTHAENTPENCMKFMDWFVPQLQAHSQTRAWYWWEWGGGAMLMRNGEPTEVGLHYSEMI